MDTIVNLTEGRDKLIDEDDVLLLNDSYLMKSRDSLSFLEKQRIRFLFKHHSLVNDFYERSSVYYLGTMPLRKGNAYYFYSVLTPFSSSLFAIRESNNHIRSVLEVAHTYDITFAEYRKLSFSCINKKHVILQENVDFLDLIIDNNPAISITDYKVNYDKSGQIDTVYVSSQKEE